MRLRNIPGAIDTIANSRYTIKEYKACKGKWNEIFGNDNEIFIEIGMGKGKFIIENALKYPNINFIGIEKYSSVLVRAIEKVEDLEIKNLLFISMDAEELEETFEQWEIGKIYLNFSDPWPKERHAKRRLTSMNFLNRYDKVLKTDGRIEFKTDNIGLFEYSLEVIEESKWILDCKTMDLHNDEEMVKNNIMTEYEEKFVSKGNNICKLIIHR